MLLQCNGCGDLMAARSDGVPFCTSCRELRDAVMWARARELKQLIEDKLFSDFELWRGNGVPHAHTHREWITGSSEFRDALVQFDDIVRPYWRECTQPPRTW